MTKLQSFVWKPTGYIKHTLIPWHSGDLNPIIKRFQYSLTEKKEHKGTEPDSDFCYTGVNQE